MKFAIIGLDGLDPDLVQKWDMPNLKAVMKRGSHGSMMSTLPPITAPAWSSIFTGRDPSWHGVMHFVDTDPFKGKKQLISSRSVKCKKIWQILNDHGLSCGIYTVPITYPVEKIDGFMVSGMDTPFEYSSVHPNVDIKIRPFVEWQGTRDMNKFYTDLVENTRDKFAKLRRLMDLFPVDFLFMVESNTDSIQHQFFHGVGPTEGRVRVVGKFFSFVDEKVGELLDLIDCPVLFVSDHGFGKYPTKWVYGNSWLHEKGLLHYDGSGIDWTRTKTYFYRAWLNVGFIKNNVGDVAEDLRKEPWVDTVYLAEDIYRGPFAKDIPDIIFVFSGDYTGNERVGNFDVIEDIPEFCRWTGHKMDAFWACSERIDPKDLTDIAPIVLRLMGLEDAIDELGEPVEYISDMVKEKICSKAY